MSKFHDALDDVLDRPISFNPSFKKITGSTNAALLLSQGFYWSKRTKDSDGWFWKTRAEWVEETGLTEDELDGAREKCRESGVMEEKLKGVPATLFYRVNKQKVYELLGLQIPEKQESGLPENKQIPEKQESGNPVDFNKEPETTPMNTSIGLDWKLSHNQEVTQHDLEEAQVKHNAPRMFEKAFGVGTWPWSSNGVWQKFERFVCEIHRKDPYAFGKYVIWRNGDGKYKAMNNKQIRTNPQVFMDTGWAEFEATLPQAREEQPTHRMPTFVDGRVVA